MPRRSWESLRVGEECIRGWAGDLNPHTARNYVYYFRLKLPNPFSYAYVILARCPALFPCNKIPVIFIMSHRGAEGEKIIAQIPMGELTPKLLDILNIKKFIIG